MDPANSSLDRRQTLAIAAGLSMAAAGALAAPAADSDFDALIQFSRQTPLETPVCELAFEAMVDIGPLVDMGQGPLGGRRIVDVLGGRFIGPRLRGVVRPGGADRQLVRIDGVHQLHALYELQTDDGAILTVSNRVTIDSPQGAPRYSRSAIEISAPDGPHGWLNKRVFVGTLQGLAPKRAAVLVRVFTVA